MKIQQLKAELENFCPPGFEWEIYEIPLMDAYAFRLKTLCWAENAITNAVLAEPDNIVADAVEEAVINIRKALLEHLIDATVALQKEIDEDSRH